MVLVIVASWEYWAGDTGLSEQVDEEAVSTSKDEAELV